MPKQDLVRRIDLWPFSGGAAGGLGSPWGGFDDNHLVWRNGTRSLYSYADWHWESGAIVNRVLQSWGDGLLEMIARLYAGEAEGPHAMLWARDVYDGTREVLFQVAQNANDPYASFGATIGVREEDDDHSNPRAVWANIGFYGTPRIYTGYKTGWTRPGPIVDVETFSRLITSVDIDVDELNLHLAVPIFAQLPDAFDYEPGQFVAIYAPGDPNLLVLYIRDALDNWQLIGGAGYAFPHTHTSVETGGVLPSSVLFDPDTILTAAGEVLVDVAGHVLVGGV